MHVAERVQDSISDAAHEEGLAPSQIQEKAAQVGRHAQETASHETKKHSAEVSGKARHEAKQAKEKASEHATGSPPGSSSTTSF